MRLRAVALMGLACTLSFPTAERSLRAEDKASSDGETKQEKISYDAHIQPIFRQTCASCHNPVKKSSGLDLTSYARRNSV